MKLVITHSDANTISNILNNLPIHMHNKETEKLMKELDKAEKVKESGIDNEIIRLNSKFRIIELSSMKEMDFTLTLPENADMGRKKISVLSPLGVALIGFRQGMTIDWEFPGGLKKIKILTVEN